MGKFRQYLDVSVNIAIVVVAICFCFLVYRSFSLQKKQASAPAASFLKPGDSLSLPELHADGDVLLAVLQTSCPFCEQSIPFYRRLADQSKSKRTKIYFVLPSGIDDSKQYLRENALPVEHVLQNSLASLHVRGTPTLILSSPQGKVHSVWVGKLSASDELIVEKTIQ